jgi:AraC-like DNA-binding protein
LAQVGWAPTQVKFAHPAPSVVREHERVFQAPIRFTAGENALVFPSELLHLPCRTADPGLLAVLSRHADQILSVLPQTDSWSDRIRRTAAEELGRGTAPVEQVARRLGLSVRSLQRRLAEEGTSYTELLDGIRHELAVRYFRDSRLSIAQIALLLGYAETSSFDRSFRRWCGMSPSDYRAGKTKPLPG